MVCLRFRFCTGLTESDVQYSFTNGCKADTVHPLTHPTSQKLREFFMIFIIITQCHNYNIIARVRYYNNYVLLIIVRSLARAFVCVRL